MSNENTKPLSNDFNSGDDSDFEIINHSDSKQDGNDYQRSEKNYDGIADSYKHYPPIESNCENPNLEKILNNSNADKITLSFSQEQIFVPTQLRNSLESDPINKPRLNHFSIVPIKIPEETMLVRRPDLPEVVLTSFDCSSHDDKMPHNFEESNVMSMEMYELPPQPSIATEISLASIPTISARDQRAHEMLNSERCSATVKPLNSSESLTYPMSIGVSHRPSESASTCYRGLDEIALRDSNEPIPGDLKCRLCAQLYKDPRALNCLHSFCLQCLINENFGSDANIPFWSGPEGISYEWKGNSDIYGTSNSTISTHDSDSPTPARSESRSSTTSSKKTDKSFKSTKKSKNSESCAGTQKLKILVCSICQNCTEMPVGGIYQLPQNFVLIRKIENLLLSIRSNVISSIWCNLCCDEIPATYHCITCAINLCGFCQEAHERQRSTAHHNINNLLDLRKTKESTKLHPDGPKFNLKCSLHPGFELKSFCLTCQQLICSDCTILLHKGHKSDALHKIFKTYQKLIKDLIEKTKPLSEYSNHSISKLAGISKKINEKCDQVQQAVEMHIAAYYEALEVHRRTLLQQIARARETKMQMILEQQLDLEKRSSQAKAVVEFSEELGTLGSESEILSFVNILLKRFEFCSNYRPPLDPKISDALHFLSEVRAPSTKAQNNIPLYGIITTQTVEPTYCTMETEGYDQLRVHKKAELTILSRDGDGVPLCHGGLAINAVLKYKDTTARVLPLQISDKRDGSYVILFTPDMAGLLVLSITINSKHIKQSPFMLRAKTLRPHTGIFHCCTFCSSKGSKTVTCACAGAMPGFKGCGHGHTGHPGRRHWSCCASVLENSECTIANKFLYFSL